MSPNAMLEAAAPRAVSIEPPANRPESLQFSHFGILNTGRQSRSSLATSATINVLVLCTVILLSLAAKKITDTRKETVTLVEPVEIKPAPPIIEPMVAPKLPPPPKIEVQQPKIVVPEVKAPEPVPQVVHMEQPRPVITPAAPKRVVAPPAPVAVNLARPQAAAVPNNDAHPSAIALGRPDNPIAPSNRPATASVNLGQRGMQGMPASNTGSGPTRVSLGSGSPGGTQMNGNGTRAVAGVRLGVSGGTGNGNGVREVAAVRLGETAAPAAARPPAMATTTLRSAPKVIYKPHPEYTAEARALHLEGTVTVRLKVMASGAVEVLGVSSGLGHGLDQSAMNAVRGTRFQPAMDASGHPIDWEGVVNVAFQLND